MGKPFLATHNKNKTLDIYSGAMRFQAFLFDYLITSIRICRVPCQSGYQLNITLTSWWVQWRLKSPASPLFTQPFIQAQIKENIKAPRHWPLCGEFTWSRWFPAQRASNAENVPIWWRHHALTRVTACQTEIQYTQKSYAKGSRFLSFVLYWCQTSSHKKAPFYWYRNSYYKPETVVRPSQVYNGDSFAHKPTSF